MSSADAGRERRGTGPTKGQGPEEEEAKKEKDTQSSATFGWTDPAVYSDLKTLTEEYQQQNTRFFVCNYCKNWNVVKFEDLIDPTKPRKNKKKVKMSNVHMELDRDFALVWKRFSLNFDGYRNALVFLMNHYNRTSRNNP
jgi:hypothetical protein